MSFKAVLLAAVLAVVLIVPAAAQTVTIPRYTVIPVTLDNSLSSATSVVGQRFTAHCSGANCGGFPADTSFEGRVSSVVRGGGRNPGQIDVRFDRAVLPDGRSMGIDGSLSSLHPNDVSVDSRTGVMTGKANARNSRNRFIAYGAGAGLLIGALSHGNVLTGTILGAAAGYLAGRLLPKAAQGSDVEVPAGTEFGIMLNQGVSFRESGRGPSVPPQNYPPEPGSGPGTPGYYGDYLGAAPATVEFTGVQPYMSGRVLMVPFRALMEQSGSSFAFNGSSNSISFNTNLGQVVHYIGTRTLYINGDRRTLAAPSRVVGGVLYVPRDLITVSTGQRAIWTPRTHSIYIG